MSATLIKIAATFGQETATEILKKLIIEHSMAFVTLAGTPTEPDLFLRLYLTLGEKALTKALEEKYLDTHFDRLHVYLRKAQGAPADERISQLRQFFGYIVNHQDILVRGPLRKITCEKLIEYSCDKVHGSNFIEFINLLGPKITALNKAARIKADSLEELRLRPNPDVKPRAPTPDELLAEFSKAAEKKDDSERFDAYTKAFGKILENKSILDTPGLCQRIFKITARD
nr:hypothetical protein K-LCC10_0020 [Kaumoebavirus]